jgi:transposase
VPSNPDHVKEQMTMAIVEADRTQWITVGVDTHRDVHVAAVLDGRGGLVATASFPTTPNGHAQLQRWALSYGSIDAIGLEGSGSWGAGLCRHLIAAGHRVLDVDRPDRRSRRKAGKSDTLDAIAAARAVQAGTATGVPKSRDATVETIRVLRLERRSALKARTQAANQLHNLVATAPDELRNELRDLDLDTLVERCARFRVGDLTNPRDGTKRALRGLARRYQHLKSEIDDLDDTLRPLITNHPVGARLLSIFGVGPDTAGQLLVTAGDNPHRLHNESSFAHLCGVAPLPASSGTTHHHRLNRGGDRHANAALYRITLTRLAHHPATRTYSERRTNQGLSPKDIKRCLKRYIAREIYRTLTTTLDP